MALSVMPFSLFPLVGAFRDMLLEEGFQDLAAIAHQGAQKTFFYRCHVQRARAGILTLDHFQERFGLLITIPSRFLAFFLLSA